MIRKSLPVLLFAFALAAGCAGPAKLTQKSEENLAKGDAWRAWTLATKALDKSPGHPDARSAATAAAGAIADDWRRRIHALADTDSILAAEEVLKFAAFRTDAARYATVPSVDGWAEDEQALRSAAARHHYKSGVAALASARPKRAYNHFSEVERFAGEYKDAARMADRALVRGQTDVAFVPFHVAVGEPTLGRQAATAWSGEVTERLPNETRFTRILPIADVEKKLSVASLGRMTRDEALRLGHRVGADRIVWGTVGDVESKTSIHLFSDVVARKVVEKDARGNRTVRWVDVPIEVVARVRTVSAAVEYELIAVTSGRTLARGKDPCQMSARALWTAYVPEAGGESYALVSETAQTADPARAKQVTERWTAVAGEGTSLGQVIDAKRTRGSSNDSRDAIARFAAGAAFVLLEELPSSSDLAHAAVSRGWKPVYQDLTRLDSVDDVDLGLTATDER